MDSLISRIRWKDVGAGISLNSNEPSPIREDYIRTIDEVTQLALTGRKIQRRRDPSAAYSPANDMDVYKLSAQLSVINRDNIHSIGEFEGKIGQLKNEYEKTRRELNEMITSQERLNTLLEQADIYFSLSDRSDLSEAEQLQLKISGAAIQGSGINNRNEYDRLKSEQQETDKKTAALKAAFKDCESIYKVYADIADTYYKISKGDYVSDLIAEKQRQGRRIKKQENKAKL